MYQFYYGDKIIDDRKDLYKLNISELIDIKEIRPTMWEEHCLECSAPACFNNCIYYSERIDGRCKRLENGLNTFSCKYGCNGEGVNVKYRRWGNLMTIIFPGTLTIEEYDKMNKDNKKLGDMLHKIAYSHFPLITRWNFIRTIEFLRRKKLLNNKENGNENSSLKNFFVFHCYSYFEKSYRLILEVYDKNTPKYKTSLDINYGENMLILDNLPSQCFKSGNLLKIYPENNLEVELDILWCDFIKGIDKREKIKNKIKCVVWDLDNTLWDGILIETDQPDQLILKKNVLNVIKELDYRGIIQSISSKNEYNQAWAVIQQLGISDYFLYPQINWGPKSLSLKKISDSLNIGIDSLALIDDSIFERQEVKLNAPEVRVYDEGIVDKLLDLDEFNVEVTKESKNRRKMYVAEQKRNTVRNESNDSLTEFIKKCHLKIEIFNPVNDEEISRCYELTVRTNQLNMSGNKYTKDQFNKLLLSNVKSFGLRCEDDFGDYGIVGFGQYIVEDNRLIFKEYAMSCRVAGKYVESALFSKLLLFEKCDIGVFEVFITKKNTLLRETLKNIGFLEISNDDKKVIYNFSQNLSYNDLVSCSFNEYK